MTINERTAPMIDPPLPAWLEKIQRYRCDSAYALGPNAQGDWVKWADVLAVIGQEPDSSLPAGDLYGAAQACWCQATMHDNREKGSGARWEALGQHLLAVAERFGALTTPEQFASLLLRNEDGTYRGAVGPTRAAPPEWFSIATAPKDGPFLVFHDGAAGRRMMVADGRMLSISRAADTPHHLSGHHWTHWMPLPDPPGAVPRSAVPHEDA